VPPPVSWLPHRRALRNWSRHLSAPLPRIWETAGHPRRHHEPRSRGQPKTGAQTVTVRTAGGQELAYPWATSLARVLRVMVLAEVAEPQRCGRP
jgi:hypothetical protein